MIEELENTYTPRRKKKRKHKQGQKRIHLHEELFCLVIHPTREPLDDWSSVCDEWQSVSLPTCVFPKGLKKNRKETDTTHSLTRVWRSQIALYVYDEERLCIDVHLIPYVHNKQWVSSVKGMFSVIHCIFITHLTAGSVVLYLHCNLDAFYCSFIKMLTIARSYLRTDTGRSWEYETYLPASSKQTESHYFCCIASFHQYMTSLSGMLTVLRFVVCVCNVFLMVCMFFAVPQESLSEKIKALKQQKLPRHVGIHDKIKFQFRFKLHHSTS